ncbi:MAG: Ribulose-phosphate 3-epimerase [Candidatus Nomurabacteria bacterium GW2011_GWB1_40_7]|uniref:Ribulose-phosphate 3-epimerase n=1 Tax=Candidatus Nomurabacteria bacterium GW2011_GWB1_40_7 TaxID=1618744 RepID=A0A0G0SYF4_9BACT|nr:MAG: Ribulose-phosphate 3-epimerase [Candidatus Nomurabacteria bacterium GW2011_GWB1_40_7]
MAEIIPAILEKNFNEIKNKLTFLRGRAKTVQIDFCDGLYVPNQTWPFSSGGFNDYDFQKILNEEEGMPFWQEFDFEFDLMVENATENFDLYMKLGPKRMIFHLGAQKNAKEFEHFLDGLDMYIRDNVEIGIAFKPNEDLLVISRLANKVDFLQCMGIDRIGFQNQKFNRKVLENIKFLKTNIQGIVLSVDGGVTLENVEALLKAGADRIMVGSSIWKSPDPIGALQDFQSLV